MSEVNIAAGSKWMPVKKGEAVTVGGVSADGGRVSFVGPPPLNAAYVLGIVAFNAGYRPAMKKAKRKPAMPPMEGGAK